MLLIQGEIYARNLRFAQIQRKNAEIRIQIIEKYKYKKSKNAADPGGKCMHTICALQPIRPTTTSGTPKQLTKCENPSHNVQCAWPLAKH